MSSNAQSPAARRLALVAQSEANRAALTSTMDEVEHKLAIAERVVSVARRIHRHRGILGAVAAWLIFAPKSARTWISRASVFLPFAIEGYRAWKSRNDDVTA